MFGTLAYVWSILFVAFNFAVFINFVVLEVILLCCDNCFKIKPKYYL